MAQFIKKNFVTQNGVLHYKEEGEDYEDYLFVARFKYNNKLKQRFITFLCNNFTTEEYFEKIRERKTPIEIVRERGFKLNRTNGE